MVFWNKRFWYLHPMGSEGGGEGGNKQIVNRRIIQSNVIDTSIMCYEISSSVSLYESLGHWIYGGVSQTPRKIFPSKNMEKVTLVNPFRPPHKKLPYTALFYRTMTLHPSSVSQGKIRGILGNLPIPSSLWYTLLPGISDFVLVCVYCHIVEAAGMCPLKWNGRCFEITYLSW